MDNQPLLFALEGSEDLGQEVADALGIQLSEHELREFEDGEHKTRPLQSVRGRDVYILHTLFGDEGHNVNDKLMRLLFFVATVKDAGARHVTALLPYLAYARKDRRTKEHDPITTRYVAQLLESMGTDCVAALEVHNRAAFDNAFRCRTLHLEAHHLFIDKIREQIGEEPVVVVSPDSGGTKRADRFRDAWAEVTGETPPTAFLEKHRSEGEVSGDAVVGDMTDRVAIIIDDMVSGGTTLLRAVDACRNKGAEAVYGVITHALFRPGSEKLYDNDVMDQLFITNSVKPQREAEDGSKVTVVPVAELFADAVRELHEL